MYLMKRFTVADALRLVQEHKLTLFYGVPPALLAIAHHENLGDYDLSSLRYIMSGAAPLPSRGEARRARERQACSPSWATVSPKPRPSRT